MIVVVTVTKVKVEKVIILVFWRDCKSRDGKVNKRRTIYGKLVGNGSMIRIMPDAVHHVTVITKGDTELAPIHQCNVGMYSEYSHTCLWKRTCMPSFVLPSRGSMVLAETKGY